MNNLLLKKKTLEKEQDPLELKEENKIRINL